MDMDFVEPDRALLYSDDEYDDDDERHEKLVDAIASMDDKKKSNIRQRCEVSKSVSDLHVPLGTGKVELGDLVGALTDKAKSVPLKKQLNRISKSQSVLPTPLYKAEQERVTRAVAYNETKEEVNKWQPIVEKNRMAEHQAFPLEKPDLRLITGSQFVKRFTPHSKLDTEVARLLGNTVLDCPERNPLTRAEERALKAMDLEEAQARRAELCKHRELLTRKEAKAHRQKKIKSKRYHKTLRQEKARAEKQALAEMEKNDPEAFLEKMMPRDRERIEERASLRHRGTSKQMKKAMIYGKFDDTAREMIQQMNQKSREITQKVHVESEDESEDEESEEEGEGKKVAATSSNPWMGVVPQRCLPAAPKEVRAEDFAAAEGEQSDVETMAEEQQEETFSTKTASSKRKKEEETGNKQQKKRKKQSEEDINVDELFDELKKNTASTLSQELVQEAKAQGGKKKRQRKNKRKKKAQVSDPEDETSSDEDEAASEDRTERDNATESLISSSTKRKRTLEDFENMSAEEDVEEKEEPAKRQRVAPKIAKIPMRKEHIIREVVEIDTDKLREHQLKTSGGGMVEEEEEEQGGSTQRMTIAAAFADDDVVGEFAEEKKRIVDAQKPKDIDLTLPGWGSWGGGGIVVSKKKRKRFTIKAAPAAPRKDAHLQNAIISQTKDNSIAKHQVSELPYCYRNVHQFEYTIKQPIGKTWNSETAYRKMIQPRVTTMMGTIIDPINKKDTFKNMNKKKAAEVEKQSGKQDSQKHQKKRR